MAIALERVSLESKKHIDESSLIVARKAATMLGYDQYLKYLGQHRSIGLAQALQELQIEPYSLASVEAYKKEKLETTLKESNKRTRRRRTEEDDDDDEYTGRWMRVDIGDYEPPIPEFVLRKAVQIVEKVPIANVLVDYLVVERKILPDPFLVVRVGTEEYYIEVWNEPVFESKL